EGGSALVGGAGADGGAGSGAAGAPPAAGARPLVSILGGDAAALAVAARLLADTWVVDDVEALPEGFRGVAVTRSGRVWDGALGELRQAPSGGRERVLERRNHRETLIAQSEAAAQAEHAAR